METPSDKPVTLPTMNDVATYFDDMAATINDGLSSFDKYAAAVRAAIVTMKKIRRWAMTDGRMGIVDELTERIGDGN